METMSHVSARSETIQNLDELLEKYTVFVPIPAKQALVDALYWLRKDTTEMETVNPDLDPMPLVKIKGPINHMMCGFCGKIMIDGQGYCPKCKRGYTL